MNESYDDIINLSHHTSKKHAQMSIHNRAAQFAPFAALTGYSGAVEETARLTDKRIETDEYEKAEIDRKLGVIADNISNTPEVTVTYFVPDSKKSGGRYVTYTGNIRRIDSISQMLIMTDEKIIPIKELLDITGELIDI